MNKTPTFYEIFKKYTFPVPNDGNCFIWAAKKIGNDEQISRMDLCNAVVGYFGQEYIQNNFDYAKLKDDKIWIEWIAGSSALSLFLKKPVVIVSEFGSIRAENGNVEILDSNERNQAINSGQNTIVYYRNHYQPLTNDPIKREQFVLNLKNLDLQQTVSKQSENREQILFDAIDNAFTGDNRIKAKQTVNEILANVSDNEKEEMMTILLGGIIAEYEHEEKKFFIKAKDDKNNKSIFGKVATAKTKTNDLPKPISLETIPMQLET